MDDAYTPREDDTRPTEELVARCLAESELDDSPALGVLHFRGGPEELACAIRLTRGKDEAERIVGANILAQLGVRTPRHVAASVSRLLEMLHDPSEQVVSAACIALGFRGSSRAITALMGQATHSSASIRYGVAVALGHHVNPETISSLLALTKDVERDVRSWATFAIAYGEVHSSAVRGALRERARDADAEVRGEALCGLAIRADDEALALVRSELQGAFYGGWAVEAAMELADSRLHEALQDLRARLDPVDRDFFELSFADAIEACK